MTQWGLDVLFNPAKRHMDEEKQRLQSTREEIGDSSGGKRIDLDSGRVVIQRQGGENADATDEAADAADAADATAAGAATNDPAEAANVAETEDLAETHDVDDEADVELTDQVPDAAAVDESD
jgi:hypothetical protein